MPSLLEQKPRVAPPLDAAFRPAVLGDRAFADHVQALGRAPTLTLALERHSGHVARRRLALSPSSSDSGLNCRIAERTLKFLLWQRGAKRVFAAGPRDVLSHLARCYERGGERAFDAEFMRQVYGGFELKPCEPSAMPEPDEPGLCLGRQLQGCRIGFDAGGSDRKVAALIDGDVVFTSETTWHPKLHCDPQYHIDGIMDSIAQAQQHLPHLDALGVSSAGIYVDNETRVASLFRRVPREAFEARIRRIYPDLAAALGVPVSVANDGDVAALAGSMALADQPVLGLALGTSLAAGYIDDTGRITGALNELAFAPLDYSPSAPRDDDWSGDRGVGADYLSQDAAIRLAESAGLALAGDDPARKLWELQRHFAEGNSTARAVFETLGVYLGYAVIQFAAHYRLKHVLVMGRVVSGDSGDLMVQTARRTVEMEDPELSSGLLLRLPDEATRRVGQSVAAASLVEL